jgi:hypothetical protein
MDKVKSFTPMETLTRESLSPISAMAGVLLNRLMGKFMKAIG